MYRRRTRIKVNRPFLTVRTGTRRQQATRCFLYGARQAVKQLSESSNGATDVRPVTAPEMPDEEPSQSVHYKRKNVEINDWQAVRDTIIDALIKHWAPASSNCSSCSMDLELEDTTVFRCLDCGPDIIFCQSCLTNTHLKKILHAPEVWKCGTFLPYQNVKTVNTGHSTNCGINIWRIVNVFDDKGRCHNLNIQFCSCEDEVTTMLKLGLWPSTATLVKVAFSVELMKWMEILILECHVSTKGFCEAIKLKNDLQPFEVNWLKELTRKETVHEYRQSYYQLGKISKSDNIVCSACPKEGGTKFVSIDGNFGLLRRKKAGDSLEPPRHGCRFFLSDKEVQDFVVSYDDSSTGSKNCHRFKAGDKLRSKSRTSKMDVKGVLGCVCRHESPVLFLNLQHGERLAYPVLLLNKLLDLAATKHQKLNVTYDIACVLFSHLKNRHKQEMLNNMTMAIPIFHCYGHKTSCQIDFNPRRKEGFGLTDGESIERLWSYLRRFGKITKEMTPSHRIDLLTDALLHYAKRKERNIGMMLVQKHKNAKSVLKDAEKNLADKINSLNSVIDQNTVHSWVDEEKTALCRKIQPVKASWEETYVDQLVKLDLLRCNPDSMEQYTRLNNSVCSLEKANGVVMRWRKHDANFKAAESAHHKRCKTNTLDKMREVAKERMFLLDLKKKYFDGQTVAIRISRQISKASISLKKLLATYNTYNSGKNTTFSDVSNPEGTIYLPACETSDKIPPALKREIIKAHYLKERANEEIGMVEAEMHNVINYYLDQYKQIIVENVAYDKRSFLIFNAVILERKLKSLKNLFDNFINTPTVPNNSYSTDTDNGHGIDTADAPDECMGDLDLVEENEDNDQYSSDEYLSDNEYCFD